MPIDLVKSAFITPKLKGRKITENRCVLHLDMDAFFAQVEQATNPALRGKPIAVVGSKKRTVIVTSSYEARKNGVKTGMTMGEGMRACPELILVPGNNRKYIDTSVKIMKILKEFSPMVEVFSIDEAFADLTGSLRLFGGKEAIGRLVKERIRGELNLTCSVGIAPNKLIAKLASDLRKPDGLVIVNDGEVPALLEDLPIEEICGIGKKMGKKLRTLGIGTMGELGRYPAQVLKKKFGIIGERLHYMGLGIDESPVVPLGDEDPAKSIGHSMTFPADVEEREDMNRYLLLLSEKVGRRARKHGCSGRTVYLYVRFSDFTGTGKRQTVKSPVNLDFDIYCVASKILDTIEIERPVRLLGVSITNLAYNGKQFPLFTGERREFLLTDAMDSVKDIYGEDALTYATVTQRQIEAGVISPAWRPQGPRRVDPK
ncbi:MAG: DNA polymerase IV [Deltaproteobacteria bacterium]|uniref:DNA polymerase IV n=1 Tax=Candidatus Zymogenus saltonus TaxID=2844893 RepID=A0A9D8KEK9_9DELT|nr:DNA polymerase IV [Candidatus Zymogenus saltonus]